MRDGFKFNLGDKVAITVSDERGEILGRAEYTTSENNYYVRYKAVDGRAIEAWWLENALEAVAD